MTITARVAEELEANAFWKAVGFVVTQRIARDATRRPLNVYTLELDVPSLFRDGRAQVETRVLSDSTLIRYPKPILPTLSYVIDLNVFFDVMQSRDKGEASLLLSLALDSEVRLAVTSEFAEELKRMTTEGSPDPVLKFAENLPTLPKLDFGIVNPLVESLRTVLWPGTPKTGKGKLNDASDLIHLASCIHHRAYGFITRDSVILRGAEALYREYRLRVISPADFSDLFDNVGGRHDRQWAIVGRQEIEIADLDEQDRAKAEDFLRGLGVDSKTILSCLDPGTTHRARSRRVTRTGGRIVSVGSWSKAGPDGTARLHLYIDEDKGNSESVIDRFFLESSMNAGRHGRLSRLDLAIAPRQERTRAVAINIGFRPLGRQDKHSTVALTKISFRGVVDTRNWLSFRRSFKEMTSYTLQESMPSWNTISDTGVVMNSDEAGRTVTISPFDFETLASPCVLLYPDRTAVIVPIREKYARKLLPLAQDQKSFLPQREAELRLERAYFFGAGKHTLLPKGTIVVFYVSRPRSEAIAFARVTFSDTLTRTQARLHLGRGVLTESELGERKNDKDEIAAFTFDNVLPFPKNLAYRELRHAGCIGGANLRSAQPLSHQKLRWIADRTFQAEVNR